MLKYRALKVVLIVVGLLFVAAIYPSLIFMQQEPALSMMLSLYFTLGIFLLIAARDPSRHRSLILFTAWSSLAHGLLMGFQAIRNWVARGELIGVAVLLIIGIVLIALLPTGVPREQLSTTAA